MHNRFAATSVLLTALAVLITGCIRIQPEPIRVEPIKIDITVHIKVDRQLDSFFNDLDASDPTLDADVEETAPANQESTPDGE